MRTAIVWQSLDTNTDWECHSILDFLAPFIHFFFTFYSLCPWFNVHQNKWKRGILLAGIQASNPTPLSKTKTSIETKHYNIMSTYETLEKILVVNNILNKYYKMCWMTKEICISRDWTTEVNNQTFFFSKDSQPFYFVNQLKWLYLY